MSRLGDLYKAMETLHKEGLSLNEDLEKQVSELELRLHRWRSHARIPRRQGPPRHQGHPRLSSFV